MSYSNYFQSLIDAPRVQAEFPRARSHNSETEYHTFPSVVRNINYVVGFNKTEQAYTALGIHLSTCEENKNFFDILKGQESKINAKIKAKFDMELCWQRRDDKVRSVIGLWRAGNINSDAPTLEALKAWHIKTLLTFKEVFTPEIQL